MNHPSKKATATLPLVRCAIYTRKSTEEGLEQEFNSPFRRVATDSGRVKVGL
jgi:hypothetical protein